MAAIFDRGIRYAWQKKLESATMVKMARCDQTPRIMMNIDFKWFGGASWMLAINGDRIICDPVLCPLGTVHNYGFFRSKRINGPHYAEQDFLNVKLWLFTHGHKDHCDLNSLNPIKTDDYIIGDSSARKAVRRFRFTNFNALDWADHKEIVLSAGIAATIEAIPAIHGLSLRKGALIGNGNGYWITIKGERAVFTMYTTGDTLPNVSTLRAIRKRACDLCVVNVGGATVGSGLPGRMVGRITMNMNDLPAMLKRLDAAKVVPIHWDAFDHYQERNIFVRANQLTVIQPGERISIVKAAG
jgi:L-ascorbate metabolism protein UlaG (beta-lactamase superfamily)